VVTGESVGAAEVKMRASLEIAGRKIKEIKIGRIPQYISSRYGAHYFTNAADLLQREERGHNIEDILESVMLRENEILEESPRALRNKLREVKDVMFKIFALN